MIDLPDILDGEDKTSHLLNCLRNNYKHIRKWAKRTQTNAFRLYDREMSKYPLAIDYYAGRISIHYFSQEDEEYPPYKEEVETSIQKLIGAHPIFWRTRQKTRQYEKRAEEKDFFNVLEYGVQFRVNLTDYLDTGLFLDHRESRQFVAKKAFGKSMLNLFAYTCSFSVHAAMQGASYTKSVDMSNTYTAWGRENFRINGLNEKQNEIVRDDVLKFLKQERRKYDIIVIDPPTISRSKKMEGLFDVQSDYGELIYDSLKLLNEGGFIFFSTNHRKFKFDTTLFPGRSIREISDKTLPIDFHDKLIHRAWMIA